MARLDLMHVFLKFDLSIIKALSCFIKIDVNLMTMYGSIYVSD